MPTSQTVNTSNDDEKLDREQQLEGDLTLTIGLSDQGVRNTKVTQKPLTWSDLLEMVKAPEIDMKDGSYFTRCPFRDDQRADANALPGSLVILDGDSSIDTETGEVVAGAPDPTLVHKALTDLGITHALYSSFSNTPQKNKYRVLVPVPVGGKDELEAMVAWLIEQLHLARVPLAPVRENNVIAQPWYLPRVPDDEAAKRFVFLEHDEGKPFPKKEALTWAKDSRDRAEAELLAEDERNGAASSETPIGRFNAEHGPDWIMSRLMSAGYERCTPARNLNGKPTFRLLAPGSQTNKPGVSVFFSRKGVWRAYSHHGKHDPLSGKATDAFGIFTLFDHDGDREAALQSLRDAANLEFMQSADEINNLEGEKEEGSEQVLYGGPDAPSIDGGAAPDMFSQQQKGLLFTAHVFPEDLLRPYEWVVDQFIYNGAMTISGTHGAGKTTALVPLCLTIAGIINNPDIIISVPRRVVYVAEDLDQVERLLYASVQHLGADMKKIRERFVAVQAHRVPVTEHLGVANIARSMIETIDTPMGAVNVRPLVVYDTVSASFALENESDNSLVADVISRLRALYRTYPLWLITHVAKSVSRADVTQQSSRGAGAWEADTQGVFRLFADGESQNQRRVLYGGEGVKRRDNGEITEISITAQMQSEVRVDLFGNMQEVPYPLVKLSISSAAAREAEVDRHAQEREEMQFGMTKDAVLEYVRKQAEERKDPVKKRERKYYPSQNDIEKALKNTGQALAREGHANPYTRDSVRKAIRALLEEGRLVKKTAEHGICVDENGESRKRDYLDFA